MFNYIFKIRLRHVFIAVLTLPSLVFIFEFYFKQENSSAPTIILWWTPLMSQFDREVNCGYQKCIFTSNRAYRNNSNLAAFLFYGSQLAVDDLPLPKSNVPWAIYHEESPKNLAFFLYEKGQALFEIISTFNRNSHFPIPLQFLEKVDLLTDMKYYMSLEEKNKFNLAPVLYIQSDCETPIERDVYVSELMRYIKVDSYGTCLNNQVLPEHLKIANFQDVYDENLMKFTARYKFTIAIENSICNDYITEKLWRPLIVGSVPIYLGSPSVQDWLPNNKSAILFNDFPTIKALADHIKLLNKNDKLYLQYLQHKITKKVTNSLLIDTLKVQDNSDHMIPGFECFVCECAATKCYLGPKPKSMYECPRPISKNKDGNFWMQYWDMGRCEAKALHYFIRELRLSNFTKEMFDRLSNQYFESNSCD